MLKQPNFSNEISLLRKILETNPKMSCAHIEDTLERYRLLLESDFRQKQQEAVYPKDKDWSNQDQILTKVPLQAGQEILDKHRKIREEFAKKNQQ